MQLGLDVRLLVWTLITFGGLVGILAKFAFKPLQRLLEEREKSIRDSLAEAQRVRDEAETIRREGQAHLQESKEAARKLIEESRRVVSDLQAEGRKQARVEADATIQRARDEIEQEVRKSVDELRGAVASLSIKVARDVIKENLNPARHEELVDEYMRQLKTEHGKTTP
jgi:F-type H+-transporting ATPase subunit b